MDDARGQSFNERSDEEKGKALFNRYLERTNQENEVERRNTLNNLRIHFTSQTVKRTIMSGKDTAPGPDGLRNSHIKRLSEADVDVLTQAFNNSLENGHLPTDWLDSHLTPIPKPEKDPSKIAYYRTITMQNTIGKLPEKIVAQMLAAELEEKNLLPPTLGSYRKGKDT